MTALTFVLASLASLRLTVLLTTDRASEGLRRRVTKRFPPRVVPLHDANGDEVEGTGTVRPRLLPAALSCDWCLGVHLSGAVMLLAHATGLADSWAMVGLGWLASSSVVGLLSDLDDRLTRASK